MDNALNIICIIYQFSKIDTEQIKYKCIRSFISCFQCECKRRKKFNKDTEMMVGNKPDKQPHITNTKVMV